MNKTSNNQKLLFIISIFAIGSLILYSNKEATDLRRPRIIGNLIQKQFLMYPEMKTEDLYKFVHQAAMGSEHAVKDFASAQKWMDEELAHMNTEYLNELYDTLTPGGSLVRVNLRPFKLGYDPMLLVNAFIKTANNFKGSIDSLKYIWSIAINLADEGNIPLNKIEMISFFKEKEKQGFPAVHHSDLYNNLYNPAYRVVAAEYLDFINKR
jgi:hypothetical protein